MCICRLVIEECFNKTVYHKVSHILAHLTGYHSMLKTDAKALIQSRVFELVSRKPHLQSKPRNKCVTRKWGQVQCLKVVWWLHGYVTSQTHDYLFIVVIALGCIQK